jgi:prepilin-type N-terminal cleavage/methylation domain-containing protein
LATPVTSKIMASPRSGFSLIELLVAIAVVAILAVIAFPLSGTLRERSATAAGVANIRQVATTLLLYASQTGGQLPYSFEPDISDFSLRLSGFISGRPEVYTTLNVREEIFRDPQAALPGGSTHFSAHPVLMPNRGLGTPYTLNRIERPSQTILVMDGAQDPASRNARASASNVTGINVPFTPGPEADEAVPPGPNTDGGSGLGNIRWRVRNNTAAKFAFADSRVEILSIGELKNRHIRLE